MIEKIFKIKEHHSTYRTEIVAGFTTFMTMAYILAVNPDMLSETGMNRDALFTATALASIIGTLVMAFVANLPFALAPGMGLNAFFTYTVVLQMGYSWQTALAAIFVEGIIFIVLTVFNIREIIVNSIPVNLKKAIAVGIGLFIAFIGFQKAGLIVGNESTMVGLGDLNNGEVIVALSGIIIIGILLIFKIKGAILLGIFGAALLGIPLGVTHWPSGTLIESPPSLNPIFMSFSFKEMLDPKIFIVIFTFLFVDMLDTVGTLVGVGAKANMLDDKGRLPKAKQALFSDAVATTCGAVLGTSTVTTYVESASGIAEGGKTGMTSFTVALLFGLALFFYPVFSIIPSAAAAPALIIVGLFMISPVKDIDLGNYSEAIPVFLTIIIMPLAYGISYGIIFGILSYVILKTVSGKFKEVPVGLYILFLLIVIKEITDYILLH